MHKLIRYLLAAVVLVPSVFLLPTAEAHGRRHYQPHHGADVWADLEHCESTHGKHPNRYQFTVRTWRSLPHRAGFPGTHTPEEQLASAKLNLLRDGPGQWPYCGPRIGLQVHHAYPLLPHPGT